MLALPAPQHLTRSLTLPLAVLYGLGVTIGAGSAFAGIMTLVEIGGLLLIIIAGHAVR